jgi:RES domain-containing protein
MKVYRLARAKYANTLSGKGASLFGNRWNSKGVEMIYTSESRALAMAEILVHLSLNHLPRDYKMLSVEIPDTVKITSLFEKSLPEFWLQFPHTIHTQKLGDAFILKKKYGVMKVPSAVVYGDFNYLINPHHKDFDNNAIKSVRDFPFDKRLVT